jgi:hypothetical protein
MAPVHRVEATDTMHGNLGFRAFLQVNLNPFARSSVILHMMIAIAAPSGLR